MMNEILQKARPHSMMALMIAALLAVSISPFSSRGAPRAVSAALRMEPVCSDTTSAAFRARLVLTLRYDGVNRKEMWHAIDLAAADYGRCIVILEEPFAEYRVYGLLQINRLSNGGYELATSLGGTAAPLQLCRNARAAVISRDAPIIWGVLLSHTVKRFVDCAFAARSQLAAKAP